MLFAGNLRLIVLDGAIAETKLLRAWSGSFPSQNDPLLHWADLLHGRVMGLAALRMAAAGSTGDQGRESTRSTASSSTTLTSATALRTAAEAFSPSMSRSSASHLASAHIAMAWAAVTQGTLLPVKPLMALAINMRKIASTEQPTALSLPSKTRETRTAPNQELSMTEVRTVFYNNMQNFINQPPHSAEHSILHSRTIKMLETKEKLLLKEEEASILAATTRRDDLDEKQVVTTAVVDIDMQRVQLFQFHADWLSAVAPMGIATLSGGNLVVQAMDLYYRAIAVCSKYTNNRSRESVGDKYGVASSYIAGAFMTQRARALGQLAVHCDQLVVAMEKAAPSIVSVNSRNGGSTEISYSASIVHYFNGQFTQGLERLPAQASFDYNEGVEDDSGGISTAIESALKYVTTLRAAGSSAAAASTTATTTTAAPPAARNSSHSSPTSYFAASSSGSSSSAAVAATLAVRTYIDGLRAGSAHCVDRTLRLTALVGAYPHTAPLLRRALPLIPSWRFLKYAPQLMGCLDKDEGAIIVDILKLLASDFPAALFYQFRVTAECLGPRGQANCAPLKNLFKNDPCDTFTAALAGLAHPELRWRYIIAISAIIQCLVHNN